MLTLNEVKAILIDTDEVTLLEVLEVSSEDIVERFSDLIENKYESLAEDLQSDRKQFDLYETET